MFFQGLSHKIAQTSRLWIFGDFWRFWLISSLSLLAYILRPPDVMFLSDGTYAKSSSIINVIYTRRSALSSHEFYSSLPGAYAFLGLVVRRDDAARCSDAGAGGLLHAPVVNGVGPRALMKKEQPVLRRVARGSVTEGSYCCECFGGYGPFVPADACVVGLCML